MHEAAKVGHVGGSVKLPAEKAVLEGDGVNTETKAGKRTNIGFWDDPDDEVDVTVDVRCLPIDDAIAGGDYENDREFRRAVHRWLSEIWQDKDARIAEIRGRVS